MNEQQKKIQKIGIKNAKSPEKFKEEFYEKEPGNYELLTEYERKNIKICILHKECGREYWTMPSVFLQGYRCPYCANITNGLKSRKTHEQFIEELKLKRNDLDDYKILSEYITKRNKIKVKHKCGREYEVRPDRFLAGDGCKICAFIESEPERRIIRYLKEYGFLDKDKDSEAKKYFIKQYSFENCKNEGTLFFDFALFENDKLHSLIEYDGEFHYIPFNGDYQKLIKQRSNDIAKNNYCLNNNITLLRIPYSVLTDRENEKIKNYRTLKEILEKFLSSTTIENDGIILIENNSFKYGKMPSKLE